MFLKSRADVTTQVLNARLKIVGGRNEKSSVAYSGDLSYQDASQLSSVHRYRHHNDPLDSNGSAIKPTSGSKLTPHLNSMGFPYRKSRSNTGISVTVSQEVHTARERGQPQPVHIPMMDIEGEGDIESEDAVSTFLSILLPFWRVLCQSLIDETLSAYPVLVLPWH